MLTASPITNQPVGKTFTVAIGLLGAGAALQLVLIGWAFWKRPPLALVIQPLPRAAQVTQATSAGPAASQTPANSVEDPSSDVLKGASGTTDPTALPRPTPVTSKLAVTEPATRFEELVAQGKELRDRGDTATAITRFREAAAMEPKSPIPLAELAATYEKISMPDKAAEQWAKISELGPSAGPYSALAETKRQLSQVKALSQVASQAPAPDQGSVDMDTPVAGIAPGATLGLLQVTTEDLRDDNTAHHLVLHVPIKARPKARVDVKDLVVDVLFYDIVDGQNVAPTSAAVNYKWTTPPADWINVDTEELAVDYQLPKLEARAAKRENRKYYGYIVRIYYKGQLQAATADPDRLEHQYPAPTTLPKDPDK